MKLPNAEQAVIDLRKLKDYCLSRGHPRGRHKARGFESILGYIADDANALRKKFLEGVREADAIVGSANEYGRRYSVDLVIAGPKGRASVRTTWIVLEGENIPRLTSCYVIPDSDNK